MTNSFESTTSKRDRRNNLILHWISLPFALGVVGVGAYRALGLPGARGRMDFVVLSAGAKSLAFLGYIFLTEMIPAFKRYHSTKTVLVMSIIDGVFWPAALGLTAYSMIQMPSTGTRNILNIILIVLLALAFIISVPIVWLSWKLHQQTREKRRLEKPTSISLSEVEKQYPTRTYVA